RALACADFFNRASDISESLLQIIVDRFIGKQLAQGSLAMFKTLRYGTECPAGFLEVTEDGLQRALLRRPARAAFRRLGYDPGEIFYAGRNIAQLCEDLV